MGDVHDSYLLRVLKYQKELFSYSKWPLNPIRQYVKTKRFDSLCAKESNVYSTARDPLLVLHYVTSYYVSAKFAIVV